MKHKFYFPRAIAKMRTWFVKFKAQLVISGPTLGLTPPQVLADSTSCQDMMDIIDAAEVAIAAAKQAVSDRDELIKTKMQVIGKDIQTMKNNAAYTVGVGELLGVIGEEDGVDTATVKTIVTLSKTPLGVDVKFDLHGCEGGNIYSKRATETAFTYFKHVSHPHTIDTRPNLGGADAEKREYKVTLEINDIEVGITSDPATITI